ncbi:hypothetical protein KQI52_07750 [bacterium]|nr:hypothetical protein [bacterium]
MTTRSEHTPHPWFIFAVPFLLGLGTYGLTQLNFVGPGVAAGWANVLTATGEPASAAISPLYRTILLLLGSIPISNTLPHLIAGWLNVVLMAAASGFFALFVYRVIDRLVPWGASSLAMFTGALAGVTQLAWTAALTLNPAPLALALALAALWLVTEYPGSRPRLLSVLLFALALSAHAAVVFLLPIFGWFFVQRRTLIRWIATTLAGVLPLALFLLPSMSPVFVLDGLFSQPPNVPSDLTGFSLLTWSKLHALTPFALLFVIVAIIRAERSWIMPGILLLVSINLASLFQFSTEFAAILAGMLVAGLTAFGLAVLFNRLPRGLSLIAWLIIPTLWFVQGPSISRHGEDLWQIHARNVMVTQRYETLIATTDHERLLAPYLYMQQAMDLRPDLILVDPTLLTSARYLESFHLDTLLQTERALASYAELRQTLAANSDANQRQRASLQFFSVWIKDAQQSLTSGVLFSSELDPGPEVPLIPEGMLWRVYAGKTYPFLFDGLDLGPIYRRADDRPLVQQTIRDYSMMFIQRAEYLRQETFTIKVADYIRWAVRIDPAYPPAVDMAREYQIHGDPILLSPKVEPRIGPALPGVTQTVDD